MTNTVTFLPAVGGDGSTVTDDSNATTGLANGGFRARLLPMFTQIINIANWILGQASAASTNAANAAASAATAINAPGTSATSTTSLTIGVGPQTLTVQAGKLFAVGMFVTVASTASPANVMTGAVTAYNSNTGAMTVSALSVSGSGTFAAWTVAVSGSPGATGPAGPVLPYIHVREQQASGTNGGSSIAGTQARVLNTVVTNTITGASLASNQITLPAGTYRIQASAPAGATGSGIAHQASLYNVTDAASIVAGTSESLYTTNGAEVSRSVVIGSFVLAASKALSLYHYTSAAVSTYGLGVASGSGLSQVYAEVEITKVA